MLKIKDIWKNAWRNLRYNYFLNVIICFIIGTIIIGGLNFSTDANRSPINVTSKIDKTKTHFDILRELLELQQLVNFDVADEDIDVDPDLTAKKYTRGVLSIFVNETTKSGSIIFGFLNGLNQLVFRNRIAESVTIFLMVFLYAFFWIFIGNVLIVGKCRYFLEERRYHKTKADRVLFIYKTTFTKNVAKIMFFRSVQLGLWTLTIIGGIIKYYEYRMIPYILAENPHISKHEAFLLSKQMMMGKKWKVFLFDLTLFPALIINSAAFRFVSMFFIDPFRECGLAEIYSQIRGEMVKSGEFSEYYIDGYMFINNGNAMTYPDELCPTKVVRTRIWLTTDWDRAYGGNTFILFFFFFSFIGWFWEVLFYLMNEGIFVNRGTMHGPWLPIYGVGGLVIIYLMRPLRRNPPLMFFGTVAACGIVEYSASFLLEKFMHQKWWDYTGYFININGRVCLEGLLVFGIAGVAMTYIFAPIVDNLLLKINPTVRKVICVVLICAFAADLVYSYMHPNVGFGITDGLI